MSLADFEHVATHKVFETEYVVCELDEMRRPCDGATMLLIHARMARWSPQIFRECLKAWRLFRTVVTQPIFAYPYVHDERWEKFISAFGFQPLLDAVPCTNGETRPLWINYALHTDPIRKQTDDPLGPAGYGAADGL